MEQKKDQVQLKVPKIHGEGSTNLKKANSDESDSSGDDEDFEEFLSWRKKR